MLQQMFRRGGSSWPNQRTKILAALRAMALGLLLTVFGSGLAAADDVASCDALASEDATRAPMVPLASINSDRAIPTCAAALAEQPASSPLVHQYARALERAGRVEDARRLYEWAAADGYAPAVAAISRLDSSASTKSASWPAAERDELGAEMAAAAGAMRRYADALPADPADPLTVLSLTGTDPDAILQWVSKNTRLVAYNGSLRGASGVLADRTGSSLDRALALAKLLTQAGQDARLAHGTLSDQQAEALFAESSALRPISRLPLPSRDELITLFTDPRIPADQAVGIADQIVAERARIDGQVTDRVPALLPVLLTAAEASSDNAGAADRASALQTLTDHYWVQIRAGMGWRDLDPDGSLIGPTVMLETLDPRSLPDTLKHHVVVRVILELKDDSGLREVELLSHTVSPSEKPFQTLTLTHIGKGLDALEQMLGSPDIRNKMLGALEEVTAWTPVLLTGDSTIVDKLFTREGAIEPANVNAFANIGSGLGALFGDVGGALDGTAPTAQPVAIPTAEWLEIEVQVPGAASRTERRTIFDLLGPAARAERADVSMTADLVRARALRLVGPTDMLIATATDSEVNVKRITADTVARMAENIRAVAAMPDGAKPSDAPGGRRVPLTLWRFAGQRLADREGAVLVSPNVFLMHDRFGWDAAAGVTHQSEFDIVFNEVGGVPFADRVRQGVVDTLLENALLGDPLAGNAAALQASDLANGRTWRRITSADLSEISSVAPDLGARIASDLSAGYIVLAPDAPATNSVGWWRISPATGTTLGMMSTGGGAELAEYGILAYQSASSAACFVGIVATIASAIGGSLDVTSAAVNMAICGAAGVGGAAGGAAANIALGVGATGGLTILAALLAHLA